jgi:excinuclease ABC subunit C
VTTKLDRLPRGPGVYLFKGQDDRTIYVGKAKSLRNRVRSYFQPAAQHPPRIARMLSEVADFDVIVVASELEALILESNWIKRERPRFNVLLRDDKQFPYLRLSVGETYPRVSLVRSARLDNSLYVGPFLPAANARRSMKLVQRHFQVATCKEVFDGKRRPCLYYHLDQCLAPCAGKTDPEEYGRAVRDARLFLEGRDRELESSLDGKMRRASEVQDYERAARHRDTLKTVRSLAVRQRISSVGLEEQDYVAHYQEGAQIALQLFQMRGGRVQSRREFTVDDVHLAPREFYAAILSQLYGDVDPAQEIYLPIAPEENELLERWLGDRRGGRVRLRVPVRGPKRQLLSTVARNAQLSFEAAFRSRHAHGVEALEALARLLGLDDPPYRIECFDISNVQGTDSVASLVVWEGGAPRKSEYRSFNIRSVDGADDFASIAEAVTRRYRRRLAEDRTLPDLVLIDGGKGQLGSAVAALARVGLPMLRVAAIAKREEEIFLQGRGAPIQAERSSPALQLVQRIRDEAHRFAVSRHRRRRSRRTLKTELTEIPGIGPVTAAKLLRAFGSLRRVREADGESLRKVAGRRVAEALLARYRGGQAEGNRSEDEASGGR